MSDRPDEYPAVPEGDGEPATLREPAPPRLEPPAASVRAPSSRRTSPLGAIALVLAVAEGGALAYVWTHPRLPPALDDRLSSLDQTAHAAASSADQAAAAAHADDSKIAGLDQSVTALQNRPQPQPAPPPPPAPPPFDPKPLQDQIAALKSGLDQAQTDARSAATQAAAAQNAGQSDQAKVGDLSSKLGDVSSKLADQSARLASLSSRLDDQSARLAAQQASLGALSSRFDQATAESQKIASLAGGAERAARLQAAAVALSIGRPTGPVPDAPPALAHFATTAPPTEASLILAFPDAADATLKASEPETAGQGFFRRIWTRAQSAVTVRDGARVIVGDPAAGIVAAARERLAAGDLQGAVATLGALTGAAADAMDDWRSRAAALVDARAALAGMMARQ